MKHILFTALLTVLAGLFHACSENDIEVFHGRQQIYFNKFYMNAIEPGTETADSTMLSFGIYEDDTRQIKAKLVVNLSGTIPTEDIRFRLKAVEGTTANSDEYELDEYYTFHKGKVDASSTDLRDTIEVKLNRGDRLESMGEEGLRLVVELVPNEQVDLGQFERRRAIIVWTEFPACPSWWDANTEIGKEVIYSLLGDYSPLKYKLFMQHADVDNEMSEELIKNNPDQAIALVQTFKAWLIDNVAEHPEYQEIIDSLKV